jgi:hypothetical protein
MIHLGAHFAWKAWATPLGSLCALFFTASALLLPLFIPSGAALGPGQSAAGIGLLMLLTGCGLALGELARRGDLLERLSPQEHGIVATLAIFIAALPPAWLWGVLGSTPPRPVLTGFALTVAATHASGLALLVSTRRLAPALQTALFWALAWWGPALLLAPSGWQGLLRRLLEPGQALLAASGSGDLAAMLPPAFLAGAVFFAGWSASNTRLSLE